MSATTLRTAPLSARSGPQTLGRPRVAPSRVAPARASATDEPCVIMDKETTAEVIRAMNISESVLGVILGGGAGSRLYPLTKTRAKPAVPLGANYRLIDIPVSNCLNSGITKVYTLTQFNSASLNRHLSTSYNSNMGSFGGRGFVEVLAASQTTTNPGWFQGTADAVRQYLWLFEEAIERGVEDLCILSGDHLYRMDYSRFVAAHRQAGAAITVAALPCDEARASAFGLMKIDDTGRIVEFAEKPKGDALRAMRVDTTVLGLDAARAAEQPYIASMGIYIANARLMRDLLLEHFPDAHDFGGEIIPGATARGEVVQAYLFDGYWEDIGTIKSFYESNLALTGTNPTFSFFDKEAPVYTASRFLPPSKVLRAEVTDSIVGDGCLIREGAVVTHSVLGVRGTVGRDARVIDAVVMGADYYETQADLAAGSGVPLGVGDGSTVRGAILDKNVRVGRNCEIVNAGKVQEADRESEGFVIKDGIIVVCKDTVLADGTKI